MGETGGHETPDPDTTEEQTSMGMGNLQRMAMQMQQDMARVQAELETLTVEGSAGGGVVKATVTGKQELVGLVIDPAVVDPEDVEMLQDLVLTAVNEAQKKVQANFSEQMSKATGGLSIPGLF
jgi:DNA-binding YbaB/EbfC family protein